MISLKARFFKKPLLRTATAAVLLLHIASPALHAATITVDTRVDENDSEAPCSLREAILSANSNADVVGCTHTGTYGDDTILLPGGAPYVLSIANGLGDEDSDETGDLDVVEGTGALTFTGDGPTVSIVDGADIDRVFEVVSSATATFNDLTIRNGTPDPLTDGPPDLCEDGGGLQVHNSANVALNNVVISGNETGSGPCRGGGISNQGVLTIDESTIGNSNIAGTDGGGIYNGCSGSATITDSTISGNTATDEGGGLWTDCGLVTLINSTVSGNDAVGPDTAGDGGGIYINSGGEVELRNVTVTQNRADSDGDDIGDGGGIYVEDAATLVWRNTIVAENFDGTGSLVFSDCFSADGTIISQDFNLIGDDTGCVPPAQWTALANDQVGSVSTPILPLFGALADNGGPTLTHALLAGSPAINTANSAGCFSDDANTGGLLNADQRGSLRPIGSACDIGAYEAGLCGDGVVDIGTEECDDGNVTSEDGCSSDCTIETGFICNEESVDSPSVCISTCGDGSLQEPEQCDDENFTDGDGCSANCEIEEGFGCVQDSVDVPTVCEPICGDEIIVSIESCDDGDEISEDGCSSDCFVETGYTCTGEPSVCTRTTDTGTCGDGTLNEGEECDDGNNTSSDGCAADCHIEIGFACDLGSPSKCKEGCGDAKPALPEICDDGNNDDGDGCSSICRVEKAFPNYCKLSPTKCVTFILGHGGCSLVK